MLVVATSAGSRAHAAQPPDAGELANDARSAFEAGRFQRAHDLLDQAYALSPKPVYVYNKGRALDLLGRVRAAYQTFLRVQVLEGVDDELRRLAAAQAQQLEPVVARALVRLRGAPADATVYFDGQVVTNLERERAVDGGRHLVCIAGDGGASLDCRQQTLAAGYRTDWDLAQPAAAPVATLLFEPRQDVVSVTIDGRPVPIDLATVREVTVPPGRHVCEVAFVTRDVWRLEIQAAAGGRYAAHVALAGRGAPGILALYREAPSEGAGAGPWVLLGVGLAALGGGVALVYVGQQEIARVSGLPRRSDGAAYGMTQRKAYAALDRGGIEVGVGAALMVVGVAFGVSGPVWAATSGSPEGSQATLRLGPGLGPGLALGGTF